MKKTIDCNDPEFRYFKEVFEGCTIEDGNHKKYIITELIDFSIGYKEKEEE